MAFSVGDRVVWDGYGMSTYYGPGPFVVEGTEPLSGPCSPKDRAQVQITVRDGDVTARRSFAASWFKLAEPRPYATTDDIKKAGAYSSALFGSMANAMYDKMVRDAEEQMRLAILGPCAAATSTYSNMFPSRPITADDIRKVVDLMSKPPAPKPDPRAERERRRREIDAVLAEDARRFPAFATARRAAVLAATEEFQMHGSDILTSTAERIVGQLHAYEALRGGMAKPSKAADDYAFDKIEIVALDAYERARGCK
jgi:hypothetical protein